MVLIGSTALAQYIELGRTPKDIDYFTPYVPCEGESFWHDDLEKWDWGPVATLNELYTIKVSHAFWELKNCSWNKHMHDLIVMQRAGATFIRELYDLLYPIWEERYGRKPGNLNVEPEDFFNAHVSREYEHDSIHQSVALYGEPLFKKILRDDHGVAVDWSKFTALPEPLKLDLVREEVYATALERYIIPADYQHNPRRAYADALRKTITSFWKGNYALFVVLNFDELKTPAHDFVALHLANQHVLKPHS